MSDTNESDPASEPPPGATPPDTAPAAARTRSAALNPAALTLLAVLGLGVAVRALSGAGTTPADPSASADRAEPHARAASRAPLPAPEAFPALPVFEPLPTQEDAPTTAAPPAALGLAPAPLPPPEPTPSGDGAAAYLAALAATPTPTPQVRRALRAQAEAPEARLSEPALAYVRACWPALQQLEQAARAAALGGAPAGPAAEPTSQEGADQPGVAQDLLRPRDLAFAALAFARLEARSGAAAAAARWPLRVLRVAALRAVAAREPLEGSVQLQLGQSALRSLEGSLAHDRWSEAELRWLSDELAAVRPLVQPAAGASSPPAGLAALPDEQASTLREARARLGEGLASALAALERRCAARLEATVPNTAAPIEEVGQ